MPLTLEEKNTRRRELYVKNMNRVKALQKDYRKKPSYIKNKRMLSWIKTQNMKSPDWEDTYTRYETATKCELCYNKFNEKKRNSKILDHDHLSGYVRNVCCCGCNNTLTVIDRRRYIVHLELYRLFCR